MPSCSPTSRPWRVTCRPAFVRTSASTAQLCQDAADAITAAHGLPGQVATLIPGRRLLGRGRRALPPSAADPTGRRGCRGAGIAQTIASGKRRHCCWRTRLARTCIARSGAIAAHSGVQLLAEVFPDPYGTRRGTAFVERIAYLAEMAGVQLAEIEHLVLVDAKAPVSFFAYPGKRASWCRTPARCNTLSTPAQDAGLPGATRHCAGRHADPPALQAAQAQSAHGELSAAKVCKAVGHLLPENAILIDEAITSGLMLGHDGGARRADLPPDRRRHRPGPANHGRRSHCLPDRPSSRSSATAPPCTPCRALWTMAREQLHVVSIVFNNASYSVLNVELERVGADEADPKASPSSILGGLTLNFRAARAGRGRACGAHRHGRRFHQTLEYALATPGPHLDQALVPESLSGAKRRYCPGCCARCRTCRRRWRGRSSKDCAAGGLRAFGFI